MAVTKKSIAVMFKKYGWSVERIARVSGVSEVYVKDVLKSLLSGRKRVGK